MADVEQRLRVVIEADGTAKFSDGTKLSADQVRRLGDELDRTNRQVEGFSDRTASAARNVTSLGRDVAQGDWRGAAESLGRMAANSGVLEKAVSGVSLSYAVAGAAMAAFAVAAYQANEETKRQANLLLVTGNYAGLVSGELNQMARSAASGIGGSVGNLRQTMEGLVATGRVTRQSLDSMAQGVELVSRFTGQSREQVTKDFADMANGVASWAAKHNESYHFITYEQYKYIESLELAGNKQEAMRVTSEALSQHLGGSLARNMGVLERSWSNIRNLASSAWDAMLNVGREKTADERVAQIAAQLDALKNRQTTGRYGGEQRQKLMEDLQAQLETAQETARLERRAADEKSRRAQEEEAKISADREKKKNQDQGDAIYERLKQQQESRLAMAKAEEENNGRLSASERYRLDGLRQISLAEEKLGAIRADERRQAVNETAEVLRGNEALEEERKARKALEDAALKEYQAREREIQSVLASNDALELQIQSVGKTKGQIDELKAQRLEHAIAMREEQLATIALFDANSPLLEQTQREIEALKQKRDLTRSLSQAEEEDDARRKSAAENKKYTEELRRDLTHALQHAFQDSKDPLEAFGSALENTIKVRVSRGMAEAILNPILRPIEQQGASFFSGLFGGGSVNMGTATGSDMDIFSSGYHSGGMVGGEPTFSRRVSTAAFSGAPRFHSGGITGDEVPIIAKKGEGVFTPGQMRAIGAGLGAASAGPNISISVINNGAPVNVRQEQGSNGMDLTLILDPIEAGLADRMNAGIGPLYHATGGRFGLRTAVN